MTQTNLNKKALETHYIEPLELKGIPPYTVISFDLEYNDAGKAPVKLIRAYLDKLLTALDTLGVDTLFVADAAYFKVLTGLKKAEPYLGYINKCKIKGYEFMDVILTINHKQLFYNPDIQSRLDLSLTTLANHIQGNHQDLGTSIIKYEDYPDTIESIEIWLEKLHQYPKLTCDVETFDLAINKAGLGTISFAWNQHEGIAFCVDIYSNIGFAVRHMLVTFFESYKGTLIFWNAVFDTKILIHELFMKHHLDVPGTVYGLDIFYKNMDDAQLITYLATNTTAGNHLSLKHNAFEFTGNYAQENITDITLINKQELLKYNLTDCLATWYVYDKNYPVMVEDMQQDTYLNVMKPSLKVITQMELTGMPLDMAKVKQTGKELQNILDTHTIYLEHSAIILNFEDKIRKEEMMAKNILLKKKVKPLSDFMDIVFNPGSPKQIGRLLHEELGLPVLDTTDTGAPATGAKTLKKLINHLKQEYNIGD